MKICWDNLEKLRYSADTQKWYKIISSKGRGYRTYEYREECDNCGEPFLTPPSSKGRFCDRKCNAITRYHNNSPLKKINDLVKYDSQNHSQWKGGYAKYNLVKYDDYKDRLSYAEKIRRNKEDKNILEVKCTYCGEWYVPTLQDVWHRVVALEGKYKNRGESRLYCSIQCKKECPSYRKKLYPEGYRPASSREVQAELRQLRFELDNYTCQKCNKHKDDLEVGLHCHHVEGIRWEPLESADIDKCITYCKNCHKEVHKKIDCGLHDLRCKEVENNGTLPLLAIHS
jgi:hypothetical protein